MGRGQTHPGQPRNRQTLRLLYQLGPEGRVDENTLGLYVFENLGREKKINLKNLNEILKIGWHSDLHGKMNLYLSNQTTVQHKVLFVPRLPSQLRSLLRWLLL